MPKRAWHDLYWHGENLARLVRSYQTLQDHAEERGDWHMYEVWGECLRKVTINCVDIAKTVLKVEELIKRKQITYT